MKPRPVYSLVVLLFAFSGCDQRPQAAPTSSTPSTSSAGVRAAGHIKTVFLQRHLADAFAGPEFFLVAEDNSVYRLYWLTNCEFAQRAETSEPTNGFPSQIGGRRVVLHSDATYEVMGNKKPGASGLSTRPCPTVEVNRLTEITPGKGSSYAQTGWIASQGVFVNDSSMELTFVDGKVHIRGGSPIDPNSTAPWARGEDYIATSFAGKYKEPAELFALVFEEAYRNQNLKRLGDLLYRDEKDPGTNARLKARVGELFPMRIKALDFRDPADSDLFDVSTNMKPDAVCEVHVSRSANELPQKTLLSLVKVPGGYLRINGVSKTQ
jgi:hypothetical protein